MSDDDTRLPAAVRDWRDGGRFLDVDGHQIFTRVREGHGPTVLLAHGYPTSSFDFGPLLDQLPNHRLVCFDFLGFGLSDKPRDHVYSLLTQADVLEAAVAELVDGPVTLLAHDMGTSVATELLARDLEGRLPFRMERALLFNGSMILDQASLTPSQRVLRSRLGPLLSRLANPLLFRVQLGQVFSDHHPLTARQAAELWALVAHHGGHRILHRLTYYLHERESLAERWHGALRDWPGRLELAWGLQDPVATSAVLDAVLDLRPHARVHRLPRLGHYPQLEDPDAFGAVVRAFLGDTDAAA